MTSQSNYVPGTPEILLEAQAFEIPGAFTNDGSTTITCGPVIS